MVAVGGNCNCKKAVGGGSSCPMNKSDAGFRNRSTLHCSSLYNNITSLLLPFFVVYILIMNCILITVITSVIGSVVVAQVDRSIIILIIVFTSATNTSYCGFNCGW